MHNQNIKSCVVCNLEKEVIEFSWKNKSKGIRQAKCKMCYRKMRNEWYQNHKEKEVKTVIRYIYRRRKEIKKWFNEIKAKSKCSHCGEHRGPVLQFHHLDPKKKDINLGEAAHIGWSIKRIKKEMAKCVVLCANCHILEHIRLRRDT